MSSIDDEWASFLSNGKMPVKQTVYESENENDNDYDSEEEMQNEHIKMSKTSRCQDLYISTKTKKPFLNITEKINVSSLFWKIPIIDYWLPNEGVIKKQMGVVCMTEEESTELDKLIQNTPYCKESKIVKQVDNKNRKTKYKDERKICVGFSTKDVMNCRSKEVGGAMRNCIALTLRWKNPENKFIEIHVKIFNTGNLEIPGLLNAELYTSVKEFLLSILAPHFLPHVLDYLPPTSDTVIINSNFYVGFNIDRDALYSILRSDKYKIDSVYESCSYPAVKNKFYFYNDYGFDKEKQRGTIRPEDQKLKKKEIEKLNKYTQISFMVFRTGSCLIVGNCTEEILMYVYEFVKQILLDEYDNIYVEGDDETLEAKKALKKNKIRKRKIQISAPYYSALKRVYADA